MVTYIIESLERTGMGSALVTFLISMMPVIELRGAIPVGISLGLEHWTAMIIAVIGNMIPVPFIILFIRKIFVWLRKHLPALGHLVDKIEKKARLKQKQVQKYRFWGLLAFVAIPLPGTGAWTGSLIAALLDMRLKAAIPSIFCGVLTAGFLISGLTFGFTSLFG